MILNIKSYLLKIDIYSILVLLIFLAAPLRFYVSTSIILEIVTFGLVVWGFAKHKFTKKIWSPTASKFVVYFFIYFIISSFISYNGFDEAGFANENYRFFLFLIMLAVMASLPLDFDKLSKDLLPNQIFVICPHPVMKNKIVEKSYDNIEVIRDFSTNDMMLVSDLLVTDYSSVIFEYALLRKPIAFYCYDLLNYNRGFYLNYPDDLPGDVYETQQALTAYLKSPEKDTLTEKYDQFIEKYMGACDGHSSERIVSSAPSPGAELPLWSKLIQACPIPLGHLQLIRLKAAFSFYGIPPPRLYGGYKLQTLSSA